MVFVTEEIFLGQLFDAYIYRMRIKWLEIHWIELFNLQALHKSQPFLYEIILKMKHLLVESSKSIFYVLIFISRLILENYFKDVAFIMQHIVNQSQVIIRISLVNHMILPYVLNEWHKDMIRIYDFFGRLISLIFLGKIKMKF